MNRSPQSEALSSLFIAFTYASPDSLYFIYRKHHVECSWLPVPSSPDSEKKQSRDLAADRRLPCAHLFLQLGQPFGQNLGAGQEDCLVTELFRAVQ